MLSDKDKWICTSDIGTEKKRLDSHYFKNLFMEKSAAVEYFNSCVKRIEKTKTKFYKFSLMNHRRDAELNSLIDIGTSGLHIIHNSFKHGEKESNWNIKKLLISMLKLFNESPSRRSTDYEKIASASKSGFPLRFYSHRWVENDVVA